MTTEYTLFYLLIFSFVFILYLIDKNRSQKYKIKTLEKWLSHSVTDFEKLAFIIKLYNSVDFKNLRPDQKKLWIEWVDENFEKGE